MPDYFHCACLSLSVFLFYLLWLLAGMLSIFPGTPIKPPAHHPRRNDYLHFPSFYPGSKPGHMHPAIIPLPSPGSGYASHHTSRISSHIPQASSHNNTYVLLWPRLKSVLSTNRIRRGLYAMPRAAHPLQRACHTIRATFAPLRPW